MATVGHVYSCSNEYNYKKVINFLKNKNANFNSFEFNVITDIKMPNIGKYYIKYLGMENNINFVNNYTMAEVIHVNEISNKFATLIKKENKILLKIGEKQYKLKNNIYMIPYFYKRKEKEFFEKQYEIEYVGDILNDKRENYPLQLMTLFNNLEFDFKLFYEKFFPALTKRQKQIFCLISLGIRPTDIGRLLGTSQSYITLEKGRMRKKMLKIKNSDTITPIIFNELNEIDDIFKEEVTMKQAILT